MKKINVHMTKEEYIVIRSDLMALYYIENNEEHAKLLLKIYRALDNWDFAEEVK